MNSTQNLNSLTPFWIVDQLMLQGVEHFCIAPGSRSSPLVLAALKCNATTHVHFDERGLGFYALGLAKATRQPVAVIVTSGTAVGNLLPAVMEAHHTHTPLILLTADRPFELRDCAANQTTDQIKIFQNFTRFYTDIPDHAEESIVRSYMAQASLYDGPVQLNCQFKEPLFREMSGTRGKPIAIHKPRLVTPPYKTHHKNGLILVGPLPHSDDVHAILALAKRLKWPVLADIQSNARGFPSPEQIRDFDKIPSYDFILHFGGALTLKHPPTGYKVHVSPHHNLQDPDRTCSERVLSDIPEFCERFEAIPRDHLPLSVPPASMNLELPPEFGLFLGSGMAIRNFNRKFWPKSCPVVFANRGLSGIDGNIATLAGLAETRPMFGVIGDQAALYDLNSLPLLNKTKYPAILMIVNDFGGGIFKHLPIVNAPEFATYWQAKHNYTFEHAAKMFDVPYLKTLEFTKSAVYEELHPEDRTGSAASISARPLRQSL